LFGCDDEKAEPPIPYTIKKIAVKKEGIEQLKKEVKVLEDELINKRRGNK